jgi:ATP-dependent DNA helicase RecQ
MRQRAPETADSSGEPLAAMRGALRKRFGFTDFRPAQVPIALAAFQGRDCLGVMPTGGGKSLCFQLPGLVRFERGLGPTVVVSPLIALMKDQVDGLCELGISAAAVNSHLDHQEQEDVLERYAEGRVELLYVAPERLRSSSFRAALQRREPGLIAIDEAHCISKWGHDFRPDYQRLGQLRNWFRTTPILALTATATPEVQDDIVASLALREPEVLVRGFDRPNLRIRVHDSPRRRDKERALLGILQEWREQGSAGSMIVYSATRRGVEAVTSLLQGAGHAALSYHGGLEPERRKEVQERFMAGAAELVVATNAFGMGVDKPDVRGVVHWEFPGSLEAYAQEIGRAGRDGEPADCHLLFSPSDRRVQEFFIDNSHPPEEVVRSLWSALVSRGSHDVWRSQEGLADECGGRAQTHQVEAALKVLDRAGAVRRLGLSDGRATVHFTDNGHHRLGERVQKVWEALEAKRGALARPQLPTTIDLDLQRMAAHLELEPRQLGAALTDLVQASRILLDRSDRVSGIRLVHREAEPGVDFEALRLKRDRELGRVDQVMAFARARSCRRKAILDYYGEGVDWSSCGTCDVCADPGPSPAGRRPLGASERAAVQAVVGSLVELGGSWATSVLCRVLAGSRDRTIERLRARERFESFGCLSRWSQPQIRDLLEAMAESGLLSRDLKTAPVNGQERRFWVLSLSKEGRSLAGAVPSELELPGGPFGPVTRAERKLRKRSTTSPDSGPGEVEELSDAERQLFESLRHRRYELASEHAVPTYVVASNRLLTALAHRRPQTRDEALELPGMGERLFERFGRELLEVVSSGSAT